MTQPRSFGTSRYTPTLHAGLVPHHMRTSQASPRAGSVPVRAGGGRRGGGSAFANAPAQGRAAASHGNVRASLSVRTRAATHRGEREFLQRQAAGRRKAETRKWIDDHRVVHTADWSGQPTQVSGACCFLHVCGWVCVCGCVCVGDNAFWVVHGIADPDNTCGCAWMSQAISSNGLAARPRGWCDGHRQWAGPRVGWLWAGTGG